MFSTLPKTSLKFSVTIILLSAGAFNFDKSGNVLFGKVLKAFAGYYLNVTQTIKFVFHRVENILRKGENTVDRQSPFPKMSSNVLERVKDDQTDK